MHLDRLSHVVCVDASATLLAVTPELLAGLPSSDQNAILAAIGKVGTVVDLLADGTVEFEIDEPEGMRTIWIPSSDIQV